MKDHEIDRLLRSAAQATADEIPAEMPFGFDTRVAALWNALAAKPNGIASLLRRVGLLSAAGIAVSALAPPREIKHSREPCNDYTNHSANPGTAIQGACFDLR